MFVFSRILPILIAVVLSTPAQACGVETDCKIGDRTYRVFQPANVSDKVIIFFHGVGGRARNQIQNSDLQQLATALEATFVAAQSLEREWNVPGAPADYLEKATTEISYFDMLQKDIAARFGSDPAQTIVAGFSSGSMVVWNLACYRGDKAMGFVAVSGTFWDPMPEGCPSSGSKLNHYHGTKDKTVTMGGDPVFESQQGNVLGAFEMFIGTPLDMSVTTRSTLTLECHQASGEQIGHAELCLFDGGHRFNAAYVADAIAQFTAN